MKIGIDAHMIGDHSGGNESFYRGILGALEPDEGDVYYLFLNPGIDGSQYEDRFTVMHYDSGSTAKRYLKELPALCRKLKLDVLHTQYYIPFVRPCPVVVLIHDISYERFGNMFTKSELYRNKILIPYAARKADRIITVSEFSKKEIVDCYHIEPSKIDVVYNAVDSSFKKLAADELDKADVRSKYGIGDSPYIACVANLQPRKNIPRLVKAFRSYIKENKETDLKLVLVGKKAWLYNESVDEAERDDKNIIMTGYVENKDIVPLLNGAKGFIYPSIYEGFGIPPLEAMSCGVPIAVSDIPVMHEVVGDKALYFDPYDIGSIAKAIAQIDEGLRLAGDDEHGYEFSWKKSADILKHTYSKLQ